MTDKYDAIERLGEIKDEIKELVREARSIIREHGDDRTENRAERCWIAHIVTALDDDHPYLMGSMYSLQDTIEELEAITPR